MAGRRPGGTGPADPIPAYAVKYYVDTLRDADSLRASFDYYRAIKQNELRRRHKLTLPVLAIAGEAACGTSVASEMRSVAEGVTSVVISSCGHCVPEEAPDALLGALHLFLAPYRDSV